MTDSYARAGAVLTMVLHNDELAHAEGVREGMERAAAIVDEHPTHTSVGHFRDTVAAAIRAEGDVQLKTDEDET